MNSQEKSFKKFPATVVEILSENMIAINRGRIHDIKKGDVFAIYGLSDDEIKDPETGESLGKLEIFRGNGEVIYLQEKMSTLRSIEKKPAKKEIIEDKLPLAFSSPFTPKSKRLIEFPEEDLPFDYPQVGDKAKPV